MLVNEVALLIDYTVWTKRWKRSVQRLQQVEEDEVGPDLWLNHLSSAWLGRHNQRPREEVAYHAGAALTGAIDHYTNQPPSGSFTEYEIRLASLHLPSAIRDE